MKDGKKKERSERSAWSCVGRFSQLPTLLGIFRFRGLVFFLALRGERKRKRKRKREKTSVRSPYRHTADRCVRLHVAMGNKDRIGPFPDLQTSIAHAPGYGRKSERRESERVESERVESERRESERTESERVESERRESERTESERVESERVESERVERRRRNQIKLRLLSWEWKFKRCSLRSERCFISKTTNTLIGVFGAVH
ncbi:hypothetical protein EYF80_044413 [Liparis tanakae]|uniref:Uncharacterized protein n=1 Tax=Liparis tanakae TaxID=230148 RepID=A0A4Z2FYG9_9TELE|nr:hypothetical protein EYF80_044413 [Liparis tanakae]